MPPELDSSGLRPVTDAIASLTSVGEHAGLGDEHVGIRRLPFEAETDFVACGLFCARFDELLQALKRMAIIEADVETRMRFAGDEIDGLVADIDGDEFQIGRIEKVAAFVERLAH